MAPTATSPRADQRARLLEAALRTLEESGPDALQARKLTAEIGTSTQAVYTLFGGMPHLFDALVADGFARFGRHVASVPETDDPVADFFSKGWAFCDWARTHAQLYRLMFGLTNESLRVHTGLILSSAESTAETPEAQTAGRVMIDSLDRVIAAQRISPADPAVVAGQFLSATHGYILLEIAGAFGPDGAGLPMFAALAVNLMVGLGDSRDAAERSLQAAIAAGSSVQA